jgi:hypothetical protein
MMHGILAAMLPRSSSSGHALAAVTSPHDGHQHLVWEATFATRTDGRWTALCGAPVVSTDLGSPPGRPCPGCDLATPGTAATGRTAPRSGARR